MHIGVIVLNFGEPESPTYDEVVAFLERIFLSNASLEGHPSPEAVRRRSRELAEARAPGLIEEYESIGGSPLHRQAKEQAELLQEELRRRGVNASTFCGMQFTEPDIPTAVRAARDAGVDRLVALPIYPLCGRSTTIAALASVRDAVSELEWDVEVVEISGWHRHPDYVPMHGDHTRAFLAERGVELDSPDTRVVFSAHGTPVKYLNDGNRYDRYVYDFCHALAIELGVEAYALGFQNHGNRPIEWTKPDIEDVVRGLGNVDAVVLAVSFMHEQSETLNELDVELRGEAEAAGARFHRVSIPYRDPRFVHLLADLVALQTGGEPRTAGVAFSKCLCSGDAEAVCLNGATFELPEGARGT